MKIFSPWQYSAFIDKETRSDALNIFIANLESNLYSNSGELTTEFIGAQNEIQETAESFSLRQERLFQNKKRIVSNLKIQAITTRDEYFYLIDRLYNEHLDLDQAYLIWEHSHKDYKSFSTTLKKYVQTEFVQKVIWANERMSHIFTSVGPIVDADLYSEVTLQSSEISVVLKEFVRKVLTLNQASFKLT